MNSKSVRCVVVGAVFALSASAYAAGSISGTVAFSGAPPKAEKLNRASDPVCAKTPAVDESVLVSKDGKSLQNAVVRVIKGAPL
jgi:hypothetical protein